MEVSSLFWYRVLIIFLLIGNDIGNLTKQMLFMIADQLTKCLPSKLFNQHVINVGLLSFFYLLGMTQLYFLIAW